MARRVVHILQSRFGLDPGSDLNPSKPSIHPLPGPMDRDNVGHHKSCNRMEAHTDRRQAIDRKYLVDRIVHCILEVIMDELKWELLTEVQGRMEADLLKSYFEAYGIDVELFQEAVGHHIYPVTINGLGYVQLFVSKEQAEEARRLLEEYINAKK